MLDPLYVLQSLYRFVTKCLDKASKLEFSSIAFPVIGTGRLGYPADLVASCMFRAVSDFKKKQKKTTLEDVRFVVYPEDQTALLVSCIEILTNLFENLQAFYSMYEDVQIGSMLFS